MIVSYDTINMHYIKPPYGINSEILNLLAKISEKIGELNTIQLNRPPAELRKSNRIYLQHFKSISSATASPDLKSATERGVLNKSGEKRLSSYNYN